MLNEKWTMTKLFGSKPPNSIMTINVLNCHVYVCVCVFRKLQVVGCCEHIMLRTCSPVASVPVRCVWTQLWFGPENTDVHDVASDQ